MELGLGHLRRCFCNKIYGEILPVGKSKYPVYLCSCLINSTLGLVVQFREVFVCGNARAKVSTGGHSQL